MEWQGAGMEMSSNMKQADRIRAFICGNLIQPARDRGDKQIVIRAGDVAGTMKLANRMPAVCSALKGKALQELCRIRIVEMSGTCPSSNFSVTFQIPSREVALTAGASSDSSGSPAETAPISRAKEPSQPTCPQCRNSVNNSFRFCPHCGIKLQAVCPECGNPVPSGDRFCSSCGKGIGKGDTE